VPTIFANFEVRPNTILDVSCISSRQSRCRMVEVVLGALGLEVIR
jgi:hypothetical protein